MMSHPPRATRDTATYRPYQKAHGKAGGKLRPKSLKILSQEHLDRAIQTGQHNPVRGPLVCVFLGCHYVLWTRAGFRTCVRTWWGVGVFRATPAVSFHRQGTSTCALSEPCSFSVVQRPFARSVWMCTGCAGVRDERSRICNRRCSWAYPC